MSVGWAYFWPLVAVGVIIGAIVGLLAFRRRKQMLWLVAGGLLTIAAAALWHGPGGAADRFSSEVDRSARLTLSNYEMTAIDARLQHSPLTRTLALQGPADSFQRGELVRVLSTLPGVSSAVWPGGKRGWPLLLEAALAALVAYLVGSLLAYLVELRRRHNAHWKW